MIYIYVDENIDADKLNGVFPEYYILNAKLFYDK